MANATYTPFNTHVSAVCCFQPADLQPQTLTFLVGGKVLRMTNASFTPSHTRFSTLLWSPTLPPCNSSVTGGKVLRMANASFTPPGRDTPIIANFTYDFNPGKCGEVWARGACAGGQNS